MLDTDIARTWYNNAEKMDEEGKEKMCLMCSDGHTTRPPFTPGLPQRRRSPDLNFRSRDEAIRGESGMGVFYQAGVNSGDSRFFDL